MVVNRGDPLESQSLVTDQQGHVRVESEAPDWASVGRITVHNPGMAIGGAILRAGAASIRLEESRSLAGAVKDQAGRPVAGTSVVLEDVRRGKDLREYYAGIFGPLQAEFTVKTDARGRWSLPDLPLMGQARIAIRDPRFIYDFTNVDLASVAGRMELVARPGVSLRGRVVYDDGKQAGGVEVFAQMQDDPSRPQVSGWSNTFTAPDGTYQLPGLPQGTYNVMVATTSKEWVAAAREGQQVFPSEADVALPDFVLARGALVEGRVFDKSTGDPIAGASVGSYGPHRPRSSAAIINAQTDAQGRYRLRVAPGESYIYVQAAPFEFDQEQKTITLKAGGARTLDLHVTPRSQKSSWWPW